MSEGSVAVDTSRLGLKAGTPDIKSVGPLAFSPDGVLFLADNVGATIYAIAVNGSNASADGRAVNVDKLDTRLAAFLGCSRDDVFIRDMAVHPSSSEVYLSVTRGSGVAAVPVVVTVGPDGTLTEVSLENVPFAETRIENAPAEDDDRKEVRVVRGTREGETVHYGGNPFQIANEGLRTVTVTDMAYVDGVLLVAGASNEEFSSSLRRIPFPFNGGGSTNSLEIFHVSHGKYETASPIRRFVPYGGDTSVLASYTCTPLVHISLRDATSEMQVKGKTVAELGSGSTPLGMVSFVRGDGEYVLVSNTTHPLMKFACGDIDRQGPLTEPKEPLGAPRQELPQAGVGLMASLNGAAVLMAQEDDEGNVSLHTYDTATL
jgi:hypothetical protein